MTRWLSARWLTAAEQGPKAAKRPSLAIKDGRPYCDRCQRMSNEVLSDEEAERWLREHEADEAHKWRSR